MNTVNSPMAAGRVPLPWQRSVLWLIFLGPFFFFSYGYANHLAAERAVADSLFYDWERHIPFLPWTILPYWSIDLFYGLSFLCCRNKQEVDRHALRLLSAQLLSVACFVLFPLRFAFARPPSEGIFGALFDALSSFDQPYNQAPSLHISLLVLIWAQFARLPLSSGWRWLIHAWAGLIAISVLTTWQHHFIDIPTGAAVGLFCLWLWPDAAPTPLRPEGTLTAGRQRLAAYYATGAGFCVGIALHLGGTALWLCWPGLALMLVASNYARSGAAGFQKYHGCHRLGAACLFAPYTLGAWLNSRWWTRRHPQADHITDDVWLGRLPTAAEMQVGGFAALCDLTAELPAPRGSWQYVNHPWLDLTPPGGQQLLAAARSIEALHGHGPVLVACALGYSRSAAAVATWLSLSGRAANMAAALALIAERRPRLLIGPALNAALADAETLLLEARKHV